MAKAAGSIIATVYIFVSTEAYTGACSSAYDGRWYCWYYYYYC